MAILLLASLVACSAVHATQPARLALWVTDTIGNSPGELCHQATPSAGATGLPPGPPTLTERDVSGWNKANGRWTLNHLRFVGNDAAQKLQNRCFVLAVDGQLLSRGLVLSSHSARLTGFQTLNVYIRNDVLELQLTSGNHGSLVRVIHVDALDTVLGQPLTAPGR